MKRLVVTLFSMITLTTYAQVEVQQQLQMTGSTNTDRQIKGVGDPTAPRDAVNAQTLQEGKLVYAIASGTDSIMINLTPPLQQYSPGTVINFKAANTITGPVVINVNGLGYVHLKKGVSNALDSADIRMGQLVSVIYDGANFQVISTLNKGCPNGYISVSKDYCIQVNENNPATWWDANVICMNNNARLCTMTEWQRACQSSGLGLSNMLNNFEWVGSAANNTAQAKTMAIDVNNNIGCDRGFHAAPSLIHAYRCCFSK